MGRNYHMDRKEGTKPPITLLSTFKRLDDDEYNLSIRNSVESWKKAILPHGNIILFDDLKGRIKGLSNIDDITVIEELKKNRWNIPTLDYMFHQAKEAYPRTQYICYVNGDIILPDDFYDRIAPLFELKTEFMLGASPFDIPCPFFINYSDKDWYTKVISQHGGYWRGDVAIDLFLFTRNALRRIPPFAVGRSAYDNYLIGHGKEVTGTLINGTRGIGAIHQDHDYRPFKNFYHVVSLPEAEKNKKIAGGYCRCSLKMATHVLDQNGLSLI